MQEQLLFSVIMPNFNKGKYIKEAIESVLAQTYQNWELVIVDDASTDNSLDVIRPFLNNNKIKLIKNVTNKGVGYTANLAVEHSSGEIIGTLDSDDILVEDALMVMIHEHKTAPDCGLIYSNHYKSDKDLNVLGQMNLLDPLPDNKCFQDILFVGEPDPTISFFFRTFKRSAYNKTEGYDNALLCYEDRDIYYKLEKVAKTKCINICLGYYRYSQEEGAYRNNSKVPYYWFLCEYRETKRRLRVNLPDNNNKKVSPFLCNVMYIYLSRYANIDKKKLRKTLQSFLLQSGYSNLKNNKLLAFLFYLNSFLYGYEPLTFSKLKKFISPGPSENGNTLYL